MSARHAAGPAPEPPEPPPPSRAQVDVALRRRYYRLWMLVIGGLDAGVGLSYLTGPTNSSNLLLIAQAVPIGTCGAVFIIVGAVLAVGVWRSGPWYYAGGFAGAVLWMIWTGALAITLKQGVALSASGLALFGGLAMLHLLIVYGAHTRTIGGGGGLSR